MAKWLDNNIDLFGNPFRGHTSPLIYGSSSICIIRYCPRFGQKKNVDLGSNQQSDKRVKAICDAEIENQFDISSSPEQKYVEEEEYLFMRYFAFTSHIVLVLCIAFLYSWAIQSIPHTHANPFFETKTRWRRTFCQWFFYDHSESLPASSGTTIFGTEKSTRFQFNSKHSSTIHHHLSKASQQNETIALPSCFVFIFIMVSFTLWQRHSFKLQDRQMDPCWPSPTH